MTENTDNAAQHRNDMYGNIESRSEDDPNVSALIPASTVVLLRDGESGVEVLMLRKNSKITFGGMWVFPGGKIDAADYPGGEVDANHLESAARAAAVRETEEEAGITVASEDYVFLSTGHRRPVNKSVSPRGFLSPRWKVLWTWPSTMVKSRIMWLNPAERYVSTDRARLIWCRPHGLPVSLITESVSRPCLRAFSAKHRALPTTLEWCQRPLVSGWPCGRGCRTTSGIQISRVPVTVWPCHRAASCLKTRSSNTETLSRSHKGQRCWVRTMLKIRLSKTKLDWVLICIISVQ